MAPAAQAGQRHGASPVCVMCRNPRPHLENLFLNRNPDPEESWGVLRIKEGALLRVGTSLASTALSGGATENRVLPPRKMGTRSMTRTPAPQPRGPQDGAECAAGGRKMRPALAATVPAVPFLKNRSEPCAGRCPPPTHSP